MDDPRTRETLDALADLFLTGTTPPVRKSPGAPGTTGGPTRMPPRKSFDVDALATTLEPKVMVTNDSLGSKPSSAASSHPKSSHAFSHLDELEGPGPISIGARSTSAAHYADRADDDASYHEEPSHLRLQNDDESDDAGAAPAAHLEAVILGNLPGFGGPWLTQYAYHLAQQRGPVAIVHIAGDHADLEVVTAQRQTVRTGIDEPLPPGSSADDLIARMHRMLSDRKQPVATWLIHLPSPSDPVQVAKAASISHWTILCGSDDMAIAGASRMLQQLKKSCAEQTDQNEIARIVGLMIMGSDESKAREAISKFNAATSTFLQQPVELIGSRKQMTPVHMRSLGGATGDGVWPAIEAFLHDLPVSDDEAAPAEHRTIDPVVAAASPANSEAVQREPETLIEQPTEPVLERKPMLSDSAASAVLETSDELRESAPYERSPLAASLLRPRPASSSPSSPSSISSSPRSPQQPQPQRYAHTSPQEPAPYRAGAEAHVDPSPSSINEPDLVSLLTGALAGSVALEARYPKQSDTQLILDQAGQLHLLRRQMGSDLKAALVDLIEARDWVIEHLSLIALTQRQCQFDMAAQPTLHLFTSDAKNAVAMVNKLGPFVKLHLLQEVRIGHAKTWVCTDLN